ncbi:MAG: hypothetical protein IPG74_13090 [Flavobacteriales bacterium]|nr:hypothetical protein [Flavobacteriales bacterium]
MMRILPLQLALSIALLTTSTESIGQAAPAWQTSAGGSINWMRTTSTGNLLVCTSEGLKGIDPATGTVGWTVKELANAPEGGYEEIANTPFVSLVPAAAEDQLVILNPTVARCSSVARSAVSAALPASTSSTPTTPLCSLAKAPTRKP